MVYQEVVSKPLTPEEAQELAKKDEEIGELKVYTLDGEVVVLYGADEVIPFLITLENPSLGASSFAAHMTYAVESVLHRVDGPAVEGNLSSKWFLEDVEYTEEEFKDQIKALKNMPLALKATDPRQWVREL